MSRSREPSDSIRAAYAHGGVEDYYRRSGAAYRNPHEPELRIALRALIGGFAPGTAIDLACGSGEATLELLALGWEVLTGIDPFTAPAYRARTGRPCRSARFEELARDGLPERADLIVCSYALHLLEPARLPLLCWQLARAAPQLLVISPNRRPTLDARWGFAERRSIRAGRAKARLYSAAARPD